MERPAGVVEKTDVATLPRAKYLIAGIVLLVVSGVLGAWIFVRGEPPFVTDVWWNDLLADWISPAVTAGALAMNWLGGGWFGVFAVPIGTAIALVIVRRPWSALYFVTASIASAGAVQILKHTFGRARPEDIIVLTDFGSYPSGHVANAATIAVAFFVIFPRLWVALVGVGWVLLMAFSRTYLHAHWLSDTLGAIMVGAGVSFVLAAVFAGLLAREPLPRRQRSS